MADYKGVLNELRSKRVAAQREVDRLDTAIGAIEDLVSVPENRSNQATQPVESLKVSPRAFSSLTMPQALNKCLRLAQRPMMKRDIQETLRAGGVRAGKSFSAHVYNTLKRLSKDGGPFYRESAHGPWALSEWQSSRTVTSNGEGTK